MICADKSTHTKRIGPPKEGVFWEPFQKIVPILHDTVCAHHIHPNFKPKARTAASFLYTIYFYFMCARSLPTCMDVHCVCAMLTRSEEGIWSPNSGVTCSCEAPCGSQEEQQVPWTIELSLQCHGGSCDVNIKALYLLFLTGMLGYTVHPEWILSMISLPHTLIIWKMLVC